MAAKQSMQTLRRLADNAERESARIVAQRRRQLDAERQRLAQLEAYVADYRQQPGNTGVFIDTMRTRQAFVMRLRAGLEQQRRVITGLDQQLELDLRRWRQARSHALGLQRFSERREREQAVRQNRKEQAQLDEIGRTMHHRATG